MKAKTDTALAITVPSDGLASRPSRVPADKRIESFGLSPKGERALFVARGDVFTAPIEKGATRNLTRSSNAHDKHATWSPDGKTIAYVSDRTGEEQLWLVPQDGLGKPEQLTTTFGSMLSAPAWSPDGARLALSDKDGKLYVVTVAGKKVVEIADDRFGGIGDYAWSPDGAHLAFSMGEHTGMRVLHVWSVADGKVKRVTSELFSSYGPAWDPEGKLLYFLSDREFAPQISDIEWNYAGNRRTGIFALALRKDVASPFAPESDEVNAGRREGREEGRGEEGRRRRQGRRGHEEGRFEGREGREEGRREGAEARRHRLGRPRLARRPRPGGGRQPRRPRRDEDGASLREGGGAVLRSRQRPEDLARDLRPEGARGDRARRRRRRLGRSRTTGRRSSFAAAARRRASSSGTSSRRRRSRRASPRRSSWSTASPPRSGRRSSTRSGAATATSSTCATCTGTTGRRSASGTGSSCRTSRTAPT